MLHPNQPIRAGHTVGEVLAGLSCFGDTYSAVAPDTGERFVLLEIKPPARHLRAGTESIEQVLTPKVLDPETSGTQLLLFHTADLQSGANWLEAADLDSDQRKQRLLQVAGMIRDLEEVRLDGVPFFYPYIAPASMVVDSSGRPLLFGAAYDFDYRTEFAFPEELERYVSPKYRDRRAMERGHGGLTAPRDDRDRIAYMRHGFSVMVWEAATGVHQYPAVDAAVIEDLPTEWEGARDLIECGLRGAWQDGDLYEITRNALEVVHVPEQSPYPEPPPYPEPTRPTDYSPPPFVDEPVGSGAAATGTVRRRTVWLAGVLSLLVGAGIVLGYFVYFGIDPRDPGEVRRLRDRVATLSADLNRARLELALHGWSSGDVSRADIERLDADNPNLLFLQLLNDLESSTKPADWEHKIAALRRAFDARGGHDPLDPRKPRFRATDIDALSAWQWEGE